MAHYLTIARPYARAIFAEANQQKTVSAWSAVLSVLSALTADRQIESLLNNPNISEQKWLDFYQAVCQKAAGQAIETIHTSFRHFLLLLIEKRRLFLLPDIQLLFHQLLSEQEGVVEVEAASAFPLSDQQCTQLTAALAKRFNTKIELKTTIDKTLIGGVLMRSQNWVLDASVKGQLEQFKQTLLGLGG